VKFKEKTPNSEPKTQKTKRGSQTGKGIMLQCPNSCKKHVKEGKEGKLKRIISLEKPSLTMTTHFKIEATCVL
jgi:hypothetical protein